MECDTSPHIFGRVNCEFVATQRIQMMQMNVPLSMMD